MRPALATLVSLALLGPAWAAGAEARPDALPAGVVRYDTMELASGVYGFIAPENDTPLVTGNSVLIVGDDGALVVDSGHSPGLTERQIAEVKRLTRQPVRFLVNTHWHPDHNAGNGAYLRAYPGLQIVATAATREGMATLLPRKEVDEKTLGQVRDMLRKDDAEGRRMPAELRSYYESSLPMLEAFVPELKRADHALPTVVFDDRLTLYLGKRRVELMFLGRGNTAGDAVVYLPDSRLLVTGDLVVHPVPYPFGSFFGEWIATLKKLAALEASTIVPGHGPVMHDMRYVDLVTRLLQSMKDQADAAVKAGLSPAEARQRLDLSAFRPLFVGDRPERAFSFDSGLSRAGFQRAYREAKEGPLHDED